MRAAESMLQLTSPAAWIELQQSAAQNYMDLTMRANLAVFEAMTSFVTGSPPAAPPQSRPAQWPDPAVEGGIA